MHLFNNIELNFNSCDYFTKLMNIYDYFYKLLCILDEIVKIMFILWPLQIQYLTTNIIVHRRKNKMKLIKKIQLVIDRSENSDNATTQAMKIAKKLDVEVSSLLSSFSAEVINPAVYLHLAGPLSCCLLGFLVKYSLVEKSHSSRM